MIRDGLVTGNRSGGGRRHDVAPNESASDPPTVRGEDKHDAWVASMRQGREVERVEISREWRLDGLDGEVLVSQVVRLRLPSLEEA
ncbi:MAG: hypothetical protein HYV09_04210 [Deltaproteobacteria bacterium]|nr:hypothetical protein [Deltaproteobacteria bacterium]